MRVWYNIYRNKELKFYIKYNVCFEIRGKRNE